MSASQRVLPHEHVPHRIYILRDTTGAVLYVGMSCDAQRRIATHLRSQPWAPEVDVARTTISEAMAWEAALAAEEAAIAAHEPRYNVRARNGLRNVALSVREYAITERHLRRAAKSGNPADVAALDEWRAALDTNPYRTA